MKIEFDIKRISAGKIDDNQMLYANAMVLDDGVADTIEADRIDVGQQQAKISISTDNNNALSRSLALSGLIPGKVVCTVETKVKQQSMTMTITGFDNKNLKA